MERRFAELDAAVMGRTVHSAGARRKRKVKPVKKKASPKTRARRKSG
jgi:hypothetical protein